MAAAKTGTIERDAEHEADHREDDGDEAHGAEGPDPARGVGPADARPGVDEVEDAGRDSPDAEDDGPGLQVEVDAAHAHDVGRVEKPHAGEREAAEDEAGEGIEDVQEADDLEELALF